MSVNFFYLKREARRKKRIEKEIRRIEKFGRKLKPIEERESDRVVVKEAGYVSLVFYFRQLVVLKKIKLST